MTDFKVKAGIPFSRRILITDGKSLWTDLSQLEARMEIRASNDPDSKLKYDFTPHLETSFEGNDLIVSWNLTGAQTRLMKLGYYDLIVSDVGPEDAKAVPVLSGYIDVDATLTSA